jgi:hypothetical protein
MNSLVIFNSIRFKNIRATHISCFAISPSKTQTSLRCNPQWLRGSLVLYS